jgi:hypothetical protein
MGAVLRAMEKAAVAAGKAAATLVAPRRNAAPPGTTQVAEADPIGWLVGATGGLAGDEADVSTGVGGLCAAPPAEDTGASLTCASGAPESDVVPPDDEAPFCVAPGENYPYREETFDEIKAMAPEILKYAEQYGVPPEAVAGAIADEYNTQTGLKGAVDWFQDEVLLNWMPEFAIELDVWVGADSKLLNATKHDLGKGNIKLETAKSLLDKYPEEFPEGMDYGGLVDLLRTDAGTSQLAAMVIREAQIELDPYLEGYSPEEKEAIYVTYYKQGPSYVQRYLDALEQDPEHRIGPGEGCGTFLQREQLRQALGLDDGEAKGGVCVDPVDGAALSNEP